MPDSLSPVIVITGGAGSGKSTVAAVFLKLGARVIDVDRLAHRLLRPRRPVWREILECFEGVRWRARDWSPRRALAPDDFLDSKGHALSTLPALLDMAGRIQRSRLAARVFAQAGQLKALNRIMHPRLKELLERRMRILRRRFHQPIVLDMAVYPEKIFRKLGHAVLWVRAPGGVRIQRLAGSKRLTLEQAGSRVRLQWKDEAFEKLADFILPNLGSDAELRLRAEELWPKIIARAGNKL